MNRKKIQFNIFIKRSFSFITFIIALIANSMVNAQSCTEVTSSASWDSRWSNGLSTGLDEQILGRDIVKYKIRWFNGNWSGWYYPGSGDIDWKDSNRRVWAYFEDHTHKYCYIEPVECGHQSLTLSIPFPNPAGSGSLIKRRADMIVLDKNFQSYPATIVSETYDVTGRLVNTERQVYQSGFGFDIVIWNVGNVSSGVYFVRTRIEESICGATSWNNTKVTIVN